MFCPTTPPGSRSYQVRRASKNWQGVSYVAELAAEGDLDRLADADRRREQQCGPERPQRRQRPTIIAASR
jgi:hypothetical protein